MKRSLQLLDAPPGATQSEPLTVRLGNRTLSVCEAGDGRAARRFVDLLVREGARVLEGAAEQASDARIVLRVPLPNAEIRLRSEALELDADLVLGSVRPGFAKHFAAACAYGVNS